MAKSISKPVQAFFANQTKMSFDDFKELMIDCYEGNMKDGVTVKEANDKIREVMFDLLELNKEDVKNSKLFRRAMQKHKIELFEVIEDVIEKRQLHGWGNDPFFMEFVEVRNLAEGDVNEFYTETPCYLSTYRVNGDHHDYALQRLGFGETFDVKTDTYGIAVGADIRSFLMGNTDWTAAVNAVYEAMDRRIKETVYAELGKIGDKLPISTQFNKAMQLTAATKPQVDELIELVRGANRDAEVVIAGTPAAIRKLSALTDLTWYSNNMKDEKYKTGKLALYEGTPLVEIPQRFEEKNGELKPMIDNTKLLVLPRGAEKFIKLIYQGDAEVFEVTNKGDRIDDIMKFEYRQSFGVAAIVTQYIGQIEIQA